MRTRRRRLTEDLLSAYVDDELDGRTRAVVDEQLTRSPEWQAALADVRAARDALRGLEPHLAVAGFWEQVLAEGGSGADRHPGRRRLGPVPRWAYAAAATAAAFVLAVAVVPRSHEVRPNVATFANAHAVRASLGGDPVAALAGAAVPVESRR
jgi:anti-sigma factor RsiW